MGEGRVSGGCQCGAVRYALYPPFNKPTICHCRMCQKAFGAFYAPLAGVPFEKFELTRGALAIFRSSDAVERGFCRECGTPLTFRNLSEDEMNVSIGSLDDPKLARPVIQYGIEGRIDWVGYLGDLPAFVTEDDGAPEHYELIRRTNHQHPDHDTAAWPPRDTGGVPR